MGIYLFTYILAESQLSSQILQRTWSRTATAYKESWDSLVQKGSWKEKAAFVCV